MIEKWELVPDPSDRFPQRHRVNVSCLAEDLKILLSELGSKAGRPWKLRRGAYQLAFYIYDLNQADRRTIKDFLSGDEMPTPSAPKRAVRSMENMKTHRVTSSPPPPPPQPPPTPIEDPLPTSPPSPQEPTPPPLADPSSQTDDEDEGETLDIGPDTTSMPEEPVKPPADLYPRSDPPPQTLPVFDPDEKDEKFESEEPKKTEGLSQSYMMSASDALVNWTETDKKPGPKVSNDDLKNSMLEEVPLSPVLEEDLGAAKKLEDEDSLTIESEPQEPVIDQAIVYEGADPPVPRGFKILRLGYVVPGNDPGLSDETQETIIQTLKSRNMPFVFHRKFSFPYTFLNDTAIQKIMGVCHENNVTGIICFGDEKRLSSLAEKCAEEDINLYVISISDSRKKYWRMGLIARLVVRG